MRPDVNFSHGNPVPTLSHAQPTIEREPPTKRRRVENDAPRQTRKSLKECLSQITPGIYRLVEDFSDHKFDRNKLGTDALSALCRTAHFRTRLDETNGNFKTEDLQYFFGWARHEIERLSKQKEYKINRVPEQPQILTSRVSKPSVVNLEAAVSVPESQLAKEEVPLAAAPAKSHGTLTTTHKLGGRKLQPRQRKEPRPSNKWFQINDRPYRTAADREAIVQGAKHLVKAPVGVASEPTVYHVDFTAEEVEKIFDCVASFGLVTSTRSIESLTRLCQSTNIPAFVQNTLKGRSVEDVGNFCSDLLAGQSRSSEDARVFSLNHDANNQQSGSAHLSRIPSLLLAREIEGNIGFGRMRTYENFQNEFKMAREDGLQLVAEFTNCAGDITAGSWVSNSNLICGTTAHSDTHNQQYNKPGNLLLCSTKLGTLRAFPDHRIPRPIVEKGENSTEAMRQSQDPWLYSSVVSSDYDRDHDLAYTSSFDKTVKVWKVDAEGKSMKALATWQHSGNVNFVATAKDRSGRVATAADSPTDAVRVYTVNPESPAESLYTSFSCSRTDANDVSQWAYYPATVQWGQAPVSQHLLLVGYSPRSLSGDDHDIPEDKRRTGEITLWDANEGRRIPVMTASTANVFEVAWHPTLPRFIVATTPTGLSVEHGIRTQIHIFQRDWERLDGAYGQFQALDCYASDINELTFMPNSVRHAYITAACTDGKVYVWDTAQGDKPVHILKHGTPLEEVVEDREREDTGVKFTAWGSSPDRFYTGASDGVVKVWNVRQKQKPLVRNLLEAPGPISYGAFSPDESKLAIGDATGRVFIFSVDKRDEPESHFITLPGGTRRIRRSKPLIPHAEPPPPQVDSDAMNDSDTDVASYSQQKYLDSQQLVLVANPVVGAVQGPQYETTGLFRRDAHLNGDPALPLLAEYERNQIENTNLSRGSRRRSMRRLRNISTPDGRLKAAHEGNQAKDLNIKDLADDVIDELKKAWALLDIEEDWGFAYEEMP